MPQLLYPQYPLDRRLDGSQSWYGHGSKEKNFFPLLGIAPQLSSLQAVITVTELSWLKCKLNVTHTIILSATLSLKMTVSL